MAMVQWLQILILGGAALGLLFAVVSLAMLVRARRQHERMSATNSFYLPPVTIFKPLKGVDESLESNLTSFFRLDYPEYELVFGVNDLDDPAIPHVKRLIRRFPHISARLVIDSHRTGHNPKVNNLCNMAPFARFDHWVISDSNVTVSPDYVTELMGHMQQPGVGLVTSLIRGVGGRTLGARLENLHLNGYIAGSTLAVNELSRVPVSIGKSMLLRKETMNRLGGFAHFADYLLEDGLLGQEIRKLGYRTRTTFHAVDNVNNAWSVRNFASRHFRWAVMRRHLNIGHYGAEIISNPIGLSAFALLLSPSLSSLAIAGTIWLGKVFCDLMSIRIMGGDAGWRSVILLPVKDLIIAGIWPVPFFVNRVNWRGNVLRVGKMTRATWLGRSSSADRRGLPSNGTHPVWRAFRINLRLRRPALQREAA